MKRRTIATLAISSLLLFFMIWSFASSAANPNGRASESNSIPGNESNEIFQNDDQKDVDADLGKWGSRIDREEYLRLRDEYIARKRGIEPGRPFDPSLRGRAIEQMERQEKGRRLESIVSGDLTPAAGGAWTPLGPSPLPNGFGSSSADVPVSGRVTSVVVDPTNPSKVYLGTAQGGVWRSLNGGSTWTTIFDSAQSLAIGALALAPSNPTILYVGTGEFNACGDCFFGVGLYRIDNVDTAPSLVGPINPLQTIGNLTYNVFNGRSITKIIVDPSNPATIFVSTARGIGGSGASAMGVVPAIATRGVYRSTNAWPTMDPTSVTFQKLVVTTDGSFPTESPQTGNVDTTDMAIEPGNPNNLLVGVQGVTASNSGVYQSTNALAATPTFAQTLPLPLLSGSGLRVQLAINKVGSTVTAYAATSELPVPTPTGSGCSSTVRGSLHKVTNPFDPSSTWSGQIAGAAGFCQGQCFYDMPIAVDPNDANVVYLGGQAGSNPNSVCGGVVRKSTDGGTTFTNDSTGLHPDDHSLFFDGAGNIYTGNDGGIWKRSASVAAGTLWTNLNNTALNTLQFESIAVHPTDQFMTIGGTQDNGTEYQQTSSGNWRNAEGGDGGYALIDNNATDTTNVTMYHTFFNQTGSQIGFDRIFKTACLPVFDSWPARGEFGGTPDPTMTVPCDGGTQLYAHNGLSLTDAVLFYAPMALGPGAPNTVYFGTDRLYRSSDRGDTMTVVSQSSLSSPGGNGSPISTIAIWRGGDNIRLVGLQNGQVWATSTGSSSLVNLAPPLPANPAGGTNKFIGRAVIDPNNKNVGYITLSYYAPAGQGIWKITNLVTAAGASPAAPVWSAAGNGIPPIPINALVIDPINSNNLYAGTDIGVYFSNDAGASWAPFGSGLPRSAVFDLQIQPSNRILRAATHGRGVWETALVSPAASTVQFTGSSSVAEGQVSTTVTVTRSGDTSFPAAVNYATSDQAGSSACNSTSNFASSRCDYIATSGTLNFAPNETSKTVSIPIVSDSYVENAEVFSVTLSNPSGLNLTLGSPAVISVTIFDTVVSNPNQIDTSSFFVREHYIDFLNREPDTSGLNFWTNNIESCGSDANCRAVKRVDTSAAFFLSIEFQQTGYLVERIYKTAFGDGTGTSNTGGTHSLSVPIVRLNEFLSDTQRIGQGVIVGQTGWEQVLENNKQAFTEEFVQRSRFLTALPLALTPTQFVDKLNDNAKDGSGNKPLSQTEHDQLISDLTAGIKTRAQVLRAVAEDPDLVNSESNRAFVLMQYFGYLRRNPFDPPEQTLDYSGYEFWLNKLNQFGDYKTAEMVKAFISSLEYRQRFGT